MSIMITILRRSSDSHTYMVNRWERTATLKGSYRFVTTGRGRVRALFTRLVSDVTPVGTTLADTGVAFVPMLVAAAVVLVVIGVAVVLVRMRLARVDH
jgi:hypothetical protein